MLRRGTGSPLRAACGHIRAAVRLCAKRRAACGRKRRRSKRACLGSTENQGSDRDARAARGFEIHATIGFGPQQVNVTLDVLERHVSAA